MSSAGKTLPSLPTGANIENLVAVAQQFQVHGPVVDVQAYGRGNVNDTYLVTAGPPHPAGAPAEGAPARFILQRLNLAVFRQPELVMANLAEVTGQVRRRLEDQPLDPGRRFEVPRPLLTRAGSDHWRDAAGDFWRALTFIDRAQSFDVIQDEGHGREVGHALGLFHHLLADLPPHRLADTLPGFHVTPGYLRHYDEVLAARGAPPSSEVNYCLKFVEARRAFAPVLEEARRQGRLKPRVIHGDPKVNNVLVDTGTGEAAALVDLDTVKPGLVHYDIGDCLRSGCNPLGEETGDWEQVRFAPDLARAILAGYLPWGRAFLSGHDYALLDDGIRLLAFELGLRFFTDYLAGNVYFKAGHREHNLARALVQFQLTASLEAQAGALRAIIRDLA
jgi:Ser/Thr protein kinase RdoA (MazF antagonist)